MYIDQPGRQFEIVLRSILNILSAIKFYLTISRYRGILNLMNVEFCVKNSHINSNTSCVYNIDSWG